jgi:hypothetical protein
MLALSRGITVDLSWAAWKALAGQWSIDKGIIDVTVEVVEYNEGDVINPQRREVTHE